MDKGRHTKLLINKALEIINEVDARALVIIIPSFEGELPELDVPVIVVGKDFDVSNPRIKKIPLPLSLGIKNVINLVSAFLIENNIISDGETFVYVTPNTLGVRTVKKGIATIKGFFEEAQTVLQRLLEIAVELSLEGKEGYPVGTIFVVGDTKNVLKHSHQIIPNPFKEHRLNVLDKNVKGIIKEFAMLDGAFIISSTGRILAAGRYLDVNPKKLDVHLPPGLGSRHLAAASISKKTKATAITLSESGVIRVFKNGEIILEYNPRMRY
ncbi:diadenylate cyclase [Thermococcus sp. M39]|uniref:DNA integrity scanning protein DisA nucleotide-binding domain protein n=1 Tax=unclassified Thermococcus TaxID=2627626 RepID=UPI001438AD72|nr:MULTISPECIES: diadenylate cyclase [unclassified Thermococcus]NJE07400.1 diadenylate cyclase [Thermococcus sp. M39]NJE12469.1 diadenylate cyclase [Thermococcus sp. LS2]